jgi:hypothetical protein
MSDIFRAEDCDFNHYLMVAIVRERLAADKQTTHRFQMVSFNLKKLNEKEVEGKGQFRAEISNSFATLEKLKLR